LPEITLGGQRLTTLRRKNRALLFYLAQQAQPVSRDHLLAFFWPDHDRSAAQKILRTMLHELRQLGPALHIDPDTVALGATAEVDTRQFEDALAARPARTPSLAATLACYRGDFLEGFSLPDPPEFDGWVVARRRHYRALFTRGLSALAQQQEVARDFDAALSTLDRALALDALQEDLQRACLRLHYLSGDRAGAIRRYETLRRQLDEELGVLPSAETRSLYDAIITDSLSMAAPVPAQTAIVEGVPPRPAPAATALLPFTGRTSELKAIQEAAGAGRLILVEGEAGIGKTRLASEFVEALRRASPRWLVLRGAAHDSDQGLPYQPVLDALRGLLAQPDWAIMRAGLESNPSWLTDVARLLPELSSAAQTAPDSEAPSDEARLWHGLSQFLRHLARLQPVVLWLEDLHWADAATVGLIGYLTRRAASAALVLLTTARATDVASGLARLLQALTHEQRLLRLSLAPLSTEETRRVAEHFSPSQAGALKTWLDRNAEGNPFFLTELVRFALQTGLLRSDGTLDEGATASTAMVPATIQNLVQSRLIRLSADARRVLEVGAVLGREFEFELLRAAAELPAIAALDTLDQLQAAGLIQPRPGERYAFDHSLTMDVVLGSMAEARARLLHRQVAETLEGQHTRTGAEHVAGLIAYHYGRGNALDRVAPFALVAGQHAASLAAWAEAIASYHQALESQTEPALRLAVLLALGEAHFHRGDFALASDTYRAAADLASALGDRASEEAAYLGLNLALLPQARYAEAVALARDLRHTGPPELALCAEFIWAAGLSVESARPLEAEQHLREAERLRAEHGPFKTRITLAQIKYQLAGIVGQQGRSEEAAALYQEALRLTHAGGGGLGLLREIMLYNNLAYHLHLLGDASAGEYAQAGIKLAQERGSLTHLSYLLSTSGEIALAGGDLDEAERFFSEGLELARQVPIAERIAGHTANLGLVAHRRGELALAREHLRDALQQAEAVGARHLGVRIRVWLAPLLPTAEAAGLLREGREIAAASGYHSLLADIAQLESTRAGG
jgi:predicted ATPase/DNA-binding SARP family transcriptional activator